MFFSPNSAAYFVQNVVSSYEQHHAALKQESLADDSTEGKECSNLIVLLSELYNFQVISCLLVFDIIRVLLDGSITEFNVELLLKVVRSKLDIHPNPTQTKRMQILANSFVKMIPQRSKTLFKLFRTSYPIMMTHLVLVPVSWSRRSRI